MEVSIRLYHFYRSALIRSIRLLLFVVLLSLILYIVANGSSPKFAVFFFNLFVMFEVFFHYKISRAVPMITVEKNKKETLYESFTLPALSGFITEVNTSDIIKNLMKYPQIKLVLQKANISSKELVLSDVSKELLAQSAFETAQTF